MNEIAANDYTLSQKTELVYSEKNCLRGDLQQCKNVRFGA